MLEYCYQAGIPKVKEKIVDMAVNGAGIRDTVRVLNVSKATVIKTLKGKEACLVQVNPNIKTMSSVPIARSVSSWRVMLLKLMSSGHLLIINRINDGYGMP